MNQALKSFSKFKRIEILKSQGNKSTRLTNNKDRSFFFLLHSLFTASTTTRRVINDFAKSPVSVRNLYSRCSVSLREFRSCTRDRNRNTGAVAKLTLSSVPILQPGRQRGQSLSAVRSSSENVIAVIVLQGT